MADESVDNQVSGIVVGNVVQARDIGVVNIGSHDTVKFELDHYLHAVVRAAEDHPVPSRSGLSAASVLLSEVYVDQELRQSSGHAGTWQQLLAAHQHLIIVGNPGGGKSSMLRRIAYTLARKQLRGDAPDCLPVRIRARTFRPGIPLADAIRDGAVTELGPFLLANLPSDIFTKAAPGGMPWLVLVDGLDEVAGISESQTALQAITEGARHQFLRFVVTTRPLQKTDLDAARNKFPTCELRAFDLPTLRHFARRWLERHSVPNPVELSKRLVDHVRRNEIKDWAAQPLTATMLCELLTNNPEQQLPEHISELYSQYVHKLFTGHIHTNAERKTSRDIIKLFEKIAAERQFRDPELPILAAMTSCVQGTLLESESADPDIRDRDLHDRLCRTGLVVSAIGGVEFAHATLEEYFAARHVVYRLTNLSNANQQHTVNQIVNAFSAHHRASEFFGISQLPVFLIDMWATMGNDTDSLLTHLVRSSPEDSWLLVRRLWEAGMAIGSKSTAELATVTDATVMDSDDQRGMAITLRSLGHPEGIARLLGMAVDMDLPDAVRITAIKDASGSSVAAAAAVSFLVMRHDFPDWEFPYSAMDAIDATPEVADDAILEGLMLIIQNKHIAEGARLHAAAIAFMNEGESIYRRLLNEWFPTSLTTLLAEEVVRGTTEAWSVLWRMVTDADLAPDRRFDAADELAMLDGESGASAFRVLAEDPDLDERYRRRAAAELADPSI